MSTIVSIVLILVSIGVFFGYVDPKYSDIKVNSVEKQDYDRALSNSNQLQAERDKLLVKLNGFKVIDTDRLTKLLPDNIDNVRFIIDIDNIAGQFGLRILNFKSSLGGDKDEKVVGRDSSVYGTMTLNFNITASYDSFLAFLKSLESSLRLIDVVGISFNSTDTGNLYDYSVTVKTYWLK